MKSKTLLILIAVVCVLGGLTYYSLKPQAPSQPTQSGQHLLAALPVNDVRHISVATTEGRVLLDKGEAVWQVTNRYGYPADFKKIADLVLKFKEAKILRSFAADEDVRKRQALYPPDDTTLTAAQRGSQVRLSGADQKDFASVIIGKPREAAGTTGHYLMLADQQTVFVVDASFRALETQPEQWLEPALTDIDAKAIQKVSCYSPNQTEPLYQLARSAADADPELLIPAAAGKLNQSKVNNVMGALGGLELNDVIDPAQPLDWGALTDRRRFEFLLTDGTLYTVETGRRGEDEEEANYLQFTVSFQPDAVVPAAADASTTEKDDENKEAEQGQDQKSAYEAAARQAHARLNPWVYKISRWKHEAFVTDAEALLEKDPAQ
jgi:hypothetical protein